MLNFTTLFLSILLWTGCMSLTFVTIGMGNVGKRITKLALNNDLKCVGGVTRTSNLGIDIGTHIGMEKEIGVNITPSDSLLELLIDTKPNIIFEATSTVPNLDGHYNRFKSILDLSTPENNPNGKYFNIITVEVGFYYPWKTHSEITNKYINESKIIDLDTLSKSKQIGIIGTGVQDLFVHSLLPSLLSLVPDFNTIKIRITFNANYPYYVAYVNAADFDSYDSCNSFMSQYWPIVNEQIVYRIIQDTLNMDLDKEQMVIPLTECNSLFNYNEKILCLGCTGNDNEYYVDNGKTIGVNTTFTINIDGGCLMVSVSVIFGLFNNLNAMSVDYDIIGPYNHQSLSFGHIDDFMVTANSAIQRVNDVINGKGIITNNVPFIQFYNLYSNLNAKNDAFKTEL